VTSQFRATAALQILLPKKPFPPHTTIFLLADAVAADEAIVAAVVFLCDWWAGYAIGEMVGIVSYCANPMV
jgi:hypothetical protein